MVAMSSQTDEMSQPTQEHGPPRAVAAEGQERLPMDMKFREIAVAAGARADDDFVLFSRLVSLRDQFRTLGVSGGAPDYEGVTLLYDHILTHGRFYEPQPLPRGFRRGKVNQCYHNACKLATFRAGLTYCEGYAMIRVGQGAADVEHGWCVTDEGKVIDVTMKEAGLSYFGVPYTWEQVAASRELPITDAIVVTKLTARNRPADPG
jgi:hypothetical protein